MNREIESYDPDALEQLVSRILDEGADDALVASLSEQLERFPQARRDYLELMSVHSMLQQLPDLRRAGAAETVPEVSRCESAIVESNSVQALRPRYLTAVTWIASIAATVGFVAGGWWLANRMALLKVADSTPPVVLEGDGEGDVIDDADGPLYVARITQVENSHWKGGESIPVGSLLPSRKMELESGKAEITFDSGAKLTIIGPAGVTIETVRSATVHNGKAWSDVPEPSIEFKITTPSAEVTDPGIRSALDVSESGASDVAVLEGVARVDMLNDKKLTEQVVGSNEAIRVMADGTRFSPIEFGPQADEHARLAAYRSGESVAYYRWSFDDEASLSTGFWKEDGWHPQQASFPAESFRVNIPEVSESILELVEGKFGNAIRLDGRGAGFRTELPGVAQDKPRTVCFWMNVPKREDGKFAYSVINWGDWTRSGGKWQIGWNSRRFDFRGVKGAIRTEIGEGYVVGTTDLRDGKWHHVACVYVGGNDEQVFGDIRNRIRFYIDGKLEPLSGYKCGTIDTHVHALSSYVAMGSYLGPSQKYFQTFKGMLDELYLFEGALTPEQINKIMDFNSPPEANEILPVRYADLFDEKKSEN